MDNQETHGTPSDQDGSEVHGQPETPRPEPDQVSRPEQPQASYRPGVPPHVPQPPPPRSTNRAVPIGIGIGVGCLILIVLFFVMIGAIVAIGRGEGTGRGGNVALIRVSGAITGGKSSSSILGGGTSGAEDLVSQLEKARKDDAIKAIVIRINSPGGSAAGSEEVWREIMRIRKAGKPVYTSMADVAASGGYYIASACDRIYADAATITGSIGVIFSGADMSELYDKIGFNPEVVKSGKFKDMGSPARPLSPEERALLQNMINSIYGQFVNAVAEGRKMPVAEVRRLADGRIYTGEQAVKLKLIDEIGGLHETVRAAGKAGGVRGEPKVVEYDRGGLLGSLFGSDEGAASQVEKALTREMIGELLKQQSLHGNFR